ncbi:hypothetical protein [Spirillospora sp. CA-294931]|uniref:hypothetical protein n=1 Tax=Spirillospora sp. CA-294931 TaxID=3240042 RepID=UPI003D934334
MKGFNRKETREAGTGAAVTDPVELARELARERALDDARRADELARVRAEAGHGRARADVVADQRMSDLDRAEQEADAAATADLSRLYREYRAAGERTRLSSLMARSGEARALRLERLRGVNLKVLVPLLLGFGLWSTTGVQQGAARLMNVSSGSPVWWVLWGLEALLIGVVCWIIYVRARLAASGGKLAATAERIGAGCLTVSVFLNLIAALPGEHAPVSGWAIPGAMFAHAIGPVGAALVAHLIGLVDGSISEADPWHEGQGDDRRPVPRLADMDLQAPARATRPTTEPNESGQDDTETVPDAALEEFDVDQGWADLMRRPGVRRAVERVRGESAPGNAADPAEEWVARTGRVTVEKIAAFLADQPPPEEGAVSSTPAPAGDAPQGAALTPPTDEPPLSQGSKPPGQIDRDQDQPDTARPPRRQGAPEGPDRVVPAVQARRAVGASTRHRIAEYMDAHPGATVKQIAAALGLGETTVKSHRRALRNANPAPDAVGDSTSDPAEGDDLR